MRTFFFIALLGAASVTARLSAQTLTPPRAESLAPKLTYLLPDAGEAGVASLKQRATEETIVLDLRWPGGDMPAAAWISAISARTSSGSLTLALISDRTPAELRESLRKGVRGCLTLAAKSAQVAADIIVETSEKEDEHAAALLRGGATAQSLINTVLEKRRYDEASVVREHSAGRDQPSEDDESPDLPDETAPKTGESKDSASAPKSPPIDAVLQRAVHVYRGLVVLKRAN